jgi:hypothetical protein
VCEIRCCLSQIECQNKQGANEIDLRVERPLWHIRTSAEPTPCRVKVERARAMPAGLHHTCVPVLIGVFCNCVTR